MTLPALLCQSQGAGGPYKVNWARMSFKVSKVHGVEEGEDYEQIPIFYLRNGHPIHYGAAS